ncbi:hypothetical protein P20480_1975 [Pseudoalteromonas sp. BSi20480]|nr:hypothetical protein P20480_1975 [Pseudoalteromonas sp. BSi20480]
MIILKHQGNSSHGFINRFNAIKLLKVRLGSKHCFLNGFVKTAA